MQHQPLDDYAAKVRQFKLVALLLRGAQTEQQRTKLRQDAERLRTWLRTHGEERDAYVPDELWEE